MKFHKYENKTHSVLASMIITLILVLAIVTCSCAQQESAIDFYKNKIITFIVPYTPGGGFDTYVRLVAPFFQKYIPGSTVIVENKTGAGGVIGTNEIFLAKPDGLTIGIVNVPGMVFNQVGGSEGVNYDLEKFSDW